MLGGLKQILCTPGPRDPTETETELYLSVSCGGTGQQWTATGAGDQPSWKRSPLTHHRATRTYLHRTGENRLSDGHKQNLMPTRTQEKGAVTPQETDPDLPVNVQESLAEAWVGGGLLQGWGH